MKLPSLFQNNSQETHLKVIKNTKRNKRVNTRLYINTIIPGFSSINNLGETIVPINHVLL